MARRRHLIPADQLTRHIPSPLCPCRPRLDIEPVAECQTGISVDWTWVHQPRTEEDEC